MALKDYQARAIKKYHDAHYEFLKVRVLKGQREEIKKKAEAEGKSMNQYILDRIF